MKPIYKSRAIKVQYKLPEEYSVCNVWVDGVKQPEDYIFVHKVGVDERPAFQMLGFWQAGLYEYAYFLEENKISHWCYATEIIDSDKYFLFDSYLGAKKMWWAKSNRGYTTNPNDSREFTEKELQDHANNTHKKLYVYKVSDVFNFVNPCVEYLPNINPLIIKEK